MACSDDIDTDDEGKRRRWRNDVSFDLWADPRTPWRTQRLIP
jgi:hypothetical protein